jgi:cytochrome c551/c552
MKTLLVLILVTNLSLANDGESLAKQRACLGCHTTKHIGISYPPAFERVAEKHKDNKDYVKNVIRNGKGKMPAHPTLSDAEINLLADYIFTFKETQ